MSSPEQFTPAANVETMTVDELMDWLEDQGIPESFCSEFKGECGVLFCISYFLI